ncbi:MAG: hypothetical protein IPP48_08545 [Chitinophagaceae bacterium]|nr:hypothetical protein [Chitinophagaceae bacterium]
MVSPSVLNYLVHHQYFHYVAPAQKVVSKLKASFYMLSVKEWNLDTIMFRYLWNPFKWIGKQFRFLQSKISIVILLIVAVALSVIGYTHQDLLPSLNGILPIIMMSIALISILFAFSYRKSALTAWVYLLIAHFLIIAAVLVNAIHISLIEIIFYVSGILLAFIVGYYCLLKIKKVDNDISLNQFHGYIYEQPTTGFLFLVSAMGILGFPMTAAFIGIDVLFTYVHSNQLPLIILMGLCFIFIELTAFRILLRVFLGPHKKLNHPVAFRSS